MPGEESGTQVEPGGRRMRTRTLFGEFFNCIPHTVYSSPSAL